MPGSARPGALRARPAAGTRSSPDPAQRGHQKLRPDRDFEAFAPSEIKDNSHAQRTEVGQAEPAAAVGVDITVR